MTRKSEIDFPAVWSVDAATAEALFEVHRTEFDAGDNSQAAKALFLARATGFDPPRWAWKFVADKILEYRAGERDLGKQLCPDVKGKAGSRKIKQYARIYFECAEEISGGSNKKRDELFWKNAAELAATRGAPPIGWEKIRKIYAEVVARDRLLASLLVQKR